MNRYFYGKPLGKIQKLVLVCLFFPCVFLGGIYLAIDSEIAWALLTSTLSLPFISILLMMMDQGPAFWHWWVSFGFGYVIDISHQTVWFEQKDDDIQEWIKENIKGPRHTIGPRRKYVFLFRNDAFAFKMRWM